MKLNKKTLILSMIDKNLTSRKLAELAGIPESSVSRILRQKHRVNPLTIKKLATALNVTSEQLIEEY